MDKQIYFVNGTKVQLVHEFTFKEQEFAVVFHGDDEFSVYHKCDLKKWEETWNYQEEQKKIARAELWKEYEDKIIHRMQDKAIKGIANRIKLNAFFSAKSGAAYAVVVADEINKLIKEEGAYDTDQHVQNIRKDSQAG